MLNALFKRFHLDRLCTLKILPQLDLAIVLASFLRPPFVAGKPPDDISIAFDFMLIYAEKSFPVGFGFGIMQEQNPRLV